MYKYLGYLGTTHNLCFCLIVHSVRELAKFAPPNEESTKMAERTKRIQNQAFLVWSSTRKSKNELRLISPRFISQEYRTHSQSGARRAISLWFHKTRCRHCLDAFVGAVHRQTTHKIASIHYDQKCPSTFSVQTSKRYSRANKNSLLSKVTPKGTHSSKLKYSSQTANVPLPDCQKWRGWHKLENMKN